ncbi:MAG: hypothetical protein J3R72DRAFT_510346 [Linnemannia gamsii]|nr:MAG: hypothetical protein J3R72DRAFT_510346 [Linnemannia gamsii]
MYSSSIVPFCFNSYKPRYTIQPDLGFFIEANDRIEKEGYSEDLSMRLGGAYIASGVQPVTNGQASAMFRFLNTHHLALNFGTASSLARLIIDILDGSWRPEHGGRNETGFSVLRMTQEADMDTMTYPIPPSDFLLRYISGLLHINIFIFDTSARPLMITHPYPRAVVGILRDSSTILGYSDYNVLGLTRTRQDDISIDQQPPSPPSSPLPPGPVATFRATKRPPQIRDGCEIDRVALETFFKEEWCVLMFHVWMMFNFFV